jgi:hypothetical protein
LVSLLLVHGASVKANAWTELEWDDATGSDFGTASAGMASASSAPALPPVHSLLRGFDSSVYADVDGRHHERRWGRAEGMRIDQCSFEGESDEAAIKRLLFQRSLLAAVEAEPTGDLARARQLVDQWQKAFASGKRMYPVCYRWDAFRHSPLTVAVQYDHDSTDGVGHAVNDNSMLELLLTLPHALHVQSAACEYPALHMAVSTGNMSGAKLLLQAGFHPDARDLVTGCTALHALLKESIVTADDPECDKLYEHCRMLLNAKADIHAHDNKGNSIWHYLAWLHWPTQLVCRLLQRAFKKGQRDKLFQANHAGNTPLHYWIERLSKTSGTDAGAEIVMLQIYAAVRELPQALQIRNHTCTSSSCLRHCSCEGQTPLQLWSNSTDVTAANLAKALHTTVNELRRLRQPTREQVQTAPVIVCPDVTHGVEAMRVPMLSAFEMHDSDFPVFRYVHQHKPCGAAAKVFCAALDRFSSGQSNAAERRVYGFAGADTAPARMSVDMFDVRFTPDKGWGLFTLVNIAKDSQSILPPPRPAFLPARALTGTDAVSLSVHSCGD